MANDDDDNVTKLQIFIFLFVFLFDILQTDLHPNYFLTTISYFHKNQSIIQIKI